MDGAEIEEWKSLVLSVVVAPHVRDYGVRLTLATHPEGPFAVPSTNKYVRYGASPRGAQALMLAAKIRALLDSRYNVSFADLRASAPAVMRHRLLLHFEGEAEGVTPDAIVEEVLEKTSELEAT
jgi:MoxR-like ATPase